ncbi:MAG: hydantoinase/oxoprolinase family protein [Betaproteobacteria bacterium]
MSFLISVDTGGTFTDIAVFDSKTKKVLYGKTLTNYSDLVVGALEAIKSTGTDIKKAELLKHGTTHVINTFIQRKGAKTALITTKGFKDTIEIGRGNRPIPFSLEYRRDDPLVPRTLRFEINERLSSDGKVVAELNLNELDDLIEIIKSEKIEAIAISFINAYANTEHEEKALNYLKEKLPDLYITSGTKISREWFEFERTSTAVANAYVGAKMQDYISTFDVKLKDQGFAGVFYMMGSNGGILSVERTIEQPVALVESGPIGGCIGAAEYAKALGFKNMIAFDMGGTTAKCALIENGAFEIQPIYYVGGYDHGFPLKIPVLDIVEVGAGGGSIASVDDFGSLSVGPKSAGSEPGPVAFSKGGTEPTVTDANLILGKISSNRFMSGKLKLDVQASKFALTEKVAKPLGMMHENDVDITAQGVLDLATSTMSSAIKEITIERGKDVRDFALFVFGGGGPLFGSTLAKQLKIPKVIIPPEPGNFSTLGMLIAGARVDLARTLVIQSNQDSISVIDKSFLELEEQAKQTLNSELKDAKILFDRFLEMRYRGQKHTVKIPYTFNSKINDVNLNFENIYKSRYGHSNKDNPIEILGIRLVAGADIPRPELHDLFNINSNKGQPQCSYRSIYFPKPYGRIDTPVWQREDLPVNFSINGPALIEEYSSTTVLNPGDKALIGQLGEISITFDMQ